MVFVFSFYIKNCILSALSKHVIQLCRFLRAFKIHVSVINLIRLPSFHGKLMDLLETRTSFQEWNEMAKTAAKRGGNMSAFRLFRNFDSRLHLISEFQN